MADLKYLNDAGLSYYNDKVWEKILNIPYSVEFAVKNTKNQVFVKATTLNNHLYALYEADKQFIKKSSNNTASVGVDKNGALSNYSDNGQAYLAIRPEVDGKFIINTPYAGAAFGVKDDGTAAFSHKTYTTYNKDTNVYSGAKNTAVLQFAGPTGLRYAVNKSASNDVTQDDYRYVGVIDSPDEFQRVYSAKQVDDIIAPLLARIEALENALNQ